jgi:hypothetical protein
MTTAQASYLKTLCEQAGDQAGEPDLYDKNLNKAEASKRLKTSDAKRSQERVSSFDC